MEEMGEMVILDYFFNLSTWCAAIVTAPREVAKYVTNV